MRKSTKDLINNLMDKAVPPPISTDKYLAFDQSKICNPESAHVNECHDILDVNSNIIKRFPPPVFLSAIKETSLIPLRLEPELILASKDTDSQ